MFRKPILVLLSTLTLAGGVLGTSTAAMADPPWARGERGFRHGGPPDWAPAHGWRRKQEFGGYDRAYRTSRYDDARRSGSYRRYGY